ncbi:MAG: type II toxin-antitoxin system VapC family toxin [Acidobacteria bacterium]|nr:type II toxin-antitoxin system VapC family toxin [Acidobacteriota bacterium]
MKVLVDTNVLVRSLQKKHPACSTARKALIALYRSKHELYLTSQNIAEFWNVCTRPIEVNGLGLSIESTDRYANQLEQFFTILPDSTEVFRTWRRLVVDHRVMGAKVHDARLVAMMKTYGLQKIVTFNVSDFTRFADITTVRPEIFI